MSTPAGQTPDTDSLGGDERDLYNDEVEGQTTLDDDIDDDDIDDDDDEILSVDPDEYSSEPHMGSVPRPLGEDEYMPDTQGDDPIYAELGEDGQGDLAPEDE